MECNFYVNEYFTFQIHLNKRTIKITFMVQREFSKMLRQQDFFFLNNNNKKPTGKL